MSELNLFSINGKVSELQAIEVFKKKETTWTYFAPNLEE